MMVSFMDLLGEASRLVNVFDKAEADLSSWTNDVCLRNSGISGRRGVEDIVAVFLDVALNKFLNI